MVYKICLVSTHGAGKTSLAILVEGELKRRGIEAKKLEEAATKTRERGLPINEETTLEAQTYILHSQFAEELAYSQRRPTPPNYEVIICDRGPDNYCYLQHRFGPDEYALQMTLGHLHKFPYSKIYFLPLLEEIIPEGSGIRSVNRSFQMEMDSEIRNFLKQYEIPHTILPQPLKEDSLRNNWVKIVVNETLKDLNFPETCWMR